MKKRALTHLTVDEFLASFPTKIRKIAEKLRRLVTRAVPHHLERVYPGWKVIGYRALSGSKSSYFAFIAPFQEKVVLGFEHGKMLADPEKILEGTGSQVRYVTIRRARAVRRKLLMPLLLEAGAIAYERMKK